MSSQILMFCYPIATLTKMETTIICSVYYRTCMSPRMCPRSTYVDRTACVIGTSWYRPVSKFGSLIENLGGARPMRWMHLCIVVVHLRRVLVVVSKFLENLSSQFSPLHHCSPLALHTAQLSAAESAAAAVAAALGATGTGHSRDSLCKDPIA